MPRSARAFGRLFDLETLALAPQADGTVRIDAVLRLRPERLKPEAPKFAAYVARYSRGLRLAATASASDGRALWSAEIEDAVWRLRLRVRDGALVTLEGPPAHAGPELRLVLDYSYKVGLFRVGVRGLPARLASSGTAGELGFVARLVEQPDWQLPFVIEPFMRGSLRYPFEGEGSEFSLVLRAEEGPRTLLVSDSRTRIRESWIVRWLGGSASRAADALRTAEAEADRYALECLTALHEDLAHLLARTTG
jgi:hypothetical protein